MVMLTVAARGFVVLGMTIDDAGLDTMALGRESNDLRVSSRSLKVGAGLWLPDRSRGISSLVRGSN